jgi:hypothetical protein
MRPMGPGEIYGAPGRPTRWPRPPALVMREPTVRPADTLRVRARSGRRAGDVRSGAGTAARLFTPGRGPSGRSRPVERGRPVTPCTINPGRSTREESEAVFNQRPHPPVQGASVIECPSRGPHALGRGSLKAERVGVRSRHDERAGRRRPRREGWTRMALGCSPFSGPRIMGITGTAVR